MTKPARADGYDTRTTEAVRRALIDIAHILGDYREHIVVVGGLVPSLITKPIDEHSHVGTIDIDLALDASNLREDDAYAHVINLLENGGFRRSQEKDHEQLREFQMVTTVDLRDGGEPVRIELDLLKPKSVKVRRKREPIIRGLRVLDISGLHLAIEYSQEITLRGHNRRGNRDSGAIKVVGPEAFLMLKGLALLNRRENKDCYDIYYVIRNSPLGPEQLGEDCRKLLGDIEARRAYESIREKFSGPDYHGPGSVVDFLEGSSEFDHDDLRMDSHRQVIAWANTLFA